MLVHVVCDGYVDHPYNVAKLCYNSTDLQAGCSKSERQIPNANTRRAINHT
jgi:hypothetical protein